MVQRTDGSTRVHHQTQRQQKQKTQTTRPGWLRCSSDVPVVSEPPSSCWGPGCLPSVASGSHQCTFTAQCHVFPAK